MTEAEDNFSDCSEKSLFSSVSTNQSFETLWQRHCKTKKRKGEVKQASEKPSKELEIIEDIRSHYSQLQVAMICLAWWLQQRLKIYPLRRGKSNLKSTISFSNTTKTMMLQQFHNHLRFRHHLQSYGNTNTNLPSTSLNEPWPYDHELKYIK